MIKRRSSSVSGGASSLAMLAALIASQQVAAHGYLSDPPSRAYACQQGLNKDCGGAQYEPQSVGETFKGFPAGTGGNPLQGPVDGRIASGGAANFSALDAQSATRWHLTEIKDRDIQFAWQYTAAHPATRHEYFITRSGWNPNLPLSRASFDGTPFCTVDGGNALPVSGARHACVIPPDKSGQHVILGVWTVGDTDAAFYNVADVNILAEAVAPDGWNTVGHITPAPAALLVGDAVKARAFGADGEINERRVGISIDTAEEGRPENWSFKLAEQINRTQELVRAGVRDEDGNIHPIKGANKVFAKAESGVRRYELQMELKEDADADLRISAISNDYALDKGRVSLPVPILGNRAMNVEVTVFDAGNKPVGSVTQQVEAGSTWLNVDVRSAPGTHQLKLVGTTVDGRTTRQDLVSIELGGEGSDQEYDAVYPQGIADYKPGTTVLQGDKVYECKPFPAGDWCKINSHHYVPGQGSNWQDAWIAR
ncbi:lytic polysaccharide monooxygenase [Pseudomonas gingeri]|uniref:lytic polysaccharide monooxygenase n=1 Tax=Pseudomonas gingeri TaxID=117681 RepID=UPI00210CEBAD|nr:lytic polysaccharide monooxygenase [Pseudomonas gingeri]